MVTSVGGSAGVATLLLVVAVLFNLGEVITANVIALFNCNTAYGLDPISETRVMLS